jgi:hypothetical protein
MTMMTAIATPMIMRIYEEICQVLNEVIMGVPTFMSFHLETHSKIQFVCKTFPMVQQTYHMF